MLVRPARMLLGKCYVRELIHPFSKKKEFAKVVHCFCLVDLAFKKILSIMLLVIVAIACLTITLRAFETHEFSPLHYSLFSV